MAKTLWSFGHSECNRVKLCKTLYQENARDVTIVGLHCVPRFARLSNLGQCDNVSCITHRYTITNCDLV